MGIQRGTERIGGFGRTRARRRPIRGEPLLAGRGPCDSQFHRQVRSRTPSRPLSCATRRTDTICASGVPRSSVGPLLNRLEARRADLAVATDQRNSEMKRGRRDDSIRHVGNAVALDQSQSLGDGGIDGNRDQGAGRSREDAADPSDDARGQASLLFQVYDLHKRNRGQADAVSPSDGHRGASCWKKSRAAQQPQMRARVSATATIIRRQRAGNRPTSRAGLRRYLRRWVRSRGRRTSR